MWNVYARRLWLSIREIPRPRVESSGLVMCLAVETHGTIVIASESCLARVSGGPTLLQSLLCLYLHSGQFVAAGVEEVEAPAAGEAEDRFGDWRAGGGDRGER